MFLLTRPSEQTVRRFLSSQKHCDLSYRDVGASRATPPATVTVDHNRVRLGEGRDTFERAAAALRRWQMFQLGWVELCWPSAAIAAGTDVAVLVRVWGAWSLNACRIVYVIDDATPVRRYGFAYGTLPDHVESGEERFSIEWDEFSRPRHPLARLGYPLTRRLQQRFARDSMAAMRRASQ